MPRIRSSEIITAGTEEQNEQEEQQEQEQEQQV